MELQTYQSALLTVFLIVAYMMTVDENVGKFILLTGSRLYLNLARLLFIVKAYPRRRFDVYMIDRRLKKIKKLKKLE